MLRRLPLVVFSAFVPTILCVAPAHAAGGTVQVTAAGANQNLGDGVVSVALCSAHSTAGTGEVVLATSVRCTINGFSSATVTLPGSDAAVVNANATSHPVIICVWGQGIFSSPLGAPYTVAKETCFDRG